MSEFPFWFIILEWLGTLSILTAYFLTSNNTNINLNLIAFFNLYGGTILSISCYIKKLWPVFIIQSIWSIIAIYHFFKINLIDK